ncbi:septin-5 isoform X3 [Trachypithecus francoisi]|uniref:septin-5 isoform X3 n=1 Tax=Trachypithecus francoisi TaxID=54180 RepID=UPI00141AA1FD|nr:septin-5 isoform X3 [Trachypithecus francoisi]
MGQQRSRRRAGLRCSGPVLSDTSAHSSSQIISFYSPGKEKPDYCPKACGLQPARCVCSQSRSAQHRAVSRGKAGHWPAAPGPCLPRLPPPKSTATSAGWGGVCRVWPGKPGQALEKGHRTDGPGGGPAWPGSQRGRRERGPGLGWGTGEVAGRRPAVTALQGGAAWVWSGDPGRGRGCGRRGRRPEAAGAGPWWGAWVPAPPPGRAGSRVGAAGADWLPGARAGRAAAAAAAAAARRGRSPRSPASASAACRRAPPARPPRTSPAGGHHEHRPAVQEQAGDPRGQAGGDPLLLTCPSFEVNWESTSPHPRPPSPEEEGTVPPREGAPEQEPGQVSGATSGSGGTGSTWQLPCCHSRWASACPSILFVL